MTECESCKNAVYGIADGEGEVRCRDCSPLGVPTRYVSEDNEEL